MDALLVLLVLGSFVYAFRKVGLWRWFWLGLAAYLGVFELAAKFITGQTLSQQFWTYAAAHGRTAWVLAALIVIGGVGLAGHLLWKRFTRK